MNIGVTGGTRSGKSSLAQKLVADRSAAKSTSGHPGRVVVVVFGRPNCDGEFDDRIARHKADRPFTWETLELGGLPSSQWSATLSQAASSTIDVVLVDCVGTLLSCLMEETLSALYGKDYFERDEMDGELVTTVALQTKPFLDLLAHLGGDGVFVTNEVGMSLVPSTAMGRLFADSLGRVNQYLGMLCKKTYLAIGGKAIDLTDLAAQPSWEQP